jgi:hypothetical protein
MKPLTVLVRRLKGKVLPKVLPEEQEHKSFPEEEILFKITRSNDTETLAHLMDAAFRETQRQGLAVDPRDFGQG